MNTEVYRIADPANLTDADISAIERAGVIIKDGGLAVFPTETVYGLGASAYSPDAAAAVYTAKGRPSDNPLIVHVAAPAEAEAFAEVSDTYNDLAKRFMPGALTVILPKKDVIPHAVTGGLSTVAVRCPSDPVARELIRRAGVPVAAPSANLSGKPSPTKAEHVVRDLSGRVDMILDGGDCTFGLESTVLKPEGDKRVRILRPGAVTAEMLENAGYTVIVDSAVTDLGAVGENPESPGMKYKHYSPTAEVILVDMGECDRAFADVVAELASTKDHRYAVLCHSDDTAGFADDAVIFTCGEDGCADDMAHELFASLRAADDAGVSEIYVPLPKKSGIGLAVYNRIIRAAGGRIVKPEN